MLDIVFFPMRTDVPIHRIRMNTRKVYSLLNWNQRIKKLTKVLNIREYVLKTLVTSIITLQQIYFTSTCAEVNAHLNYDFVNILTATVQLYNL